MKKISNWGNYPTAHAELSTFYSEEDLRALLQNEGDVIARGLGRCYGDSSLNDRIVSTLQFNKIVSFDQTDGTIICEAGVSLEDILKTFVPRGFFLPVTPGTKFVTVGGAIASDVHGKNHHIDGSFSNHVISMDVMLGDGTVASCSRENNSDLYWATCGGMGLTGVILRATFKLQKIETAYIKQETLKAKNLGEMMDCFEESKSFRYSVAWIDCLAEGDDVGRGVLMRGDHAKKEDAPRGIDPLVIKEKWKFEVPFNLPGFALNKYAVSAFNSIYYQKARHGETAIVDYDSFFYPLDRIGNWNRMYGKKGFVQYQVLFPKDKSEAGLKKILAKVGSLGKGSFLAVLKLFGVQEGLISFPMEGYTLALDFPVRPRLEEMLLELDDIVMENGGRLYLAKDARMSADFFSKTYSNSGMFKKQKSGFDSSRKFGSHQSKRLEI